jgi:hypothetical protein
MVSLVLAVLFTRAHFIFDENGDARTTATDAKKKVGLSVCVSNAVPGAIEASA